MQRLSGRLFLILSLLCAAISFAARAENPGHDSFEYTTQDDPQEVGVFELVHSVRKGDGAPQIGIKPDADFTPEFLALLRNSFENGGSNGVAAHIEEQLRDPVTRDYMHRMQQSGQAPKVVDVRVHPDRVAAVQYINERLKNMGMPNFGLNPLIDESLPQQTEAQPSAAKKWLRYSFGAGVALVATFITGPEFNKPDYLYLLIPTASAGLASVALEVQFAHPTINSKFWTPIWKLGGPITGRLMNIGVNFAYGMIGYFAYAAGFQLATHLGADPASMLAPISVEAAAKASLIGGLIFHAAMGQYQTDLAIEQTRGNITPTERYGKETTGVLINNGARVGGWVVPGPLDKIAQSVFALWKTLPQVYKTHIAPRRQDARIREAVQKGTPDAWLQLRLAVKKDEYKRCQERITQQEKLAKPENPNH